MTIAERIGFSAVQFRAGSFFRRGNVSDFGVQVDLHFKQPVGRVVSGFVKKDDQWCASANTN